MVTYERVLQKIQELQPGESAHFRGPSVKPCNLGDTPSCIVRRQNEDEFAPEYHYAEYTENHTNRYCDNDNPEVMAKVVYNFLTK